MVIPRRELPAVTRRDSVTRTSGAWKPPADAGRPSPPAPPARSLARRPGHLGPLPPPGHLVEPFTPGGAGRAVRPGADLTTPADAWRPMSNAVAPSAGRAAASREVTGDVHPAGAARRTSSACFTCQLFPSTRASAHLARAGVEPDSRSPAAFPAACRTAGQPRPALGSRRRIGRPMTTGRDGPSLPIWAPVIAPIPRPCGDDAEIRPSDHVIADCDRHALPRPPQIAAGSGLRSAKPPRRLRCTPGASSRNAPTCVPPCPRPRAFLSSGPFPASGVPPTSQPADEHLDDGEVALDLAHQLVDVDRVVAGLHARSCAPAAHTALIRALTWKRLLPVLQPSDGDPPPRAARGAGRRRGHLAAAPAAAALLAALALRAARSVSTDRLVADLWGERAPASATGSLQNTVSALRKPLGRDVLVTQAPGYRLAVEPRTSTRTGSSGCSPRRATPSRRGEAVAARGARALARAGARRPRRGGVRPARGAGGSTSCARRRRRSGSTRSSSSAGTRRSSASSSSSRRDASAAGAAPAAS